MHLQYNIELAPLVHMANCAVLEVQINIQAMSTFSYHLCLLLELLKRKTCRLIVPACEGTK